MSADFLAFNLRQSRSGLFVSAGILRTLLLYSPVLAGLLLMAPRLLSPQFGLFDDGVTLANSREIASGDWDLGWEASNGRFRPAYWLQYGMLYILSGPDPLVFFMWNTFLLTSSTALLIALVRFTGGTTFQAWSAGTLFVLSGPIIENFYTLSKGEPLQVFGILLGLLLACLAARSQVWWGRVAYMLGATMAFFLANTSKETSLAMLPVGVAWMGVAWLFHKRSGSGQGHRRAAMILATLFLAAVAFLLLRSQYVAAVVTEEGYTGQYDLAVGSMAASAFRWTGWLARDFPYLLPLGLFIAWQALSLRRLVSAPMYLHLLIWMGAWFAIFLPWVYTQEYYMLPFAVGAVALGSLAIEQTLRSFLVSMGVKKLLSGAFLAAAAGLLLATIPNNLTNARLQLAVDAANAEMLEKVAASAPQHGMLLVNLPAENEYNYEIGLHLIEIFNRPDLLVDRFFFQKPEPGKDDELSYLVAVPWIDNQPLLSVRMGLYEAGADQWKSSFERSMGEVASLDHQSLQSFRLFTLDFLRLFCPLFRERNYCASSPIVIDRRQLTYGWDVYSIVRSVGNQALPASFEPATGVWMLLLEDGSLQEVKFGGPGDVPLAGDWNGDGLTGLGIYRASEQTWYLDFERDGQADLELQFTGMQAGDIPLAGDWDGDGIVTPGYFRPMDASWHFRNSLTSGREDLPVVTAGSAGGIPLTGDWNGDGRDTVGVYRPERGEVELEDDLASELSGVDFLGPAGASPVAADWGGTGKATLAFVSDGLWSLSYLNCDCQPSNLPKPFEFGAPQSYSLAGKWGRP